MTRINVQCSIKPKFQIGDMVWIIDWIGHEGKSLVAFVRPVEVSGLTFHYDLFGRGASLVPDGYLIDELRYQKVFTDSNVFTSQEDAVEAIPNVWSI